MQHIQEIPRISKIVFALSLVLVALTIVVWGKSVGLMLACICSIALGMATFLKSKDAALKTAGAILFALGLLWLFLAPFWLSSPPLDPLLTPVPSVIPPG